MNNENIYYASKFADPSYYKNLSKEVAENMAKGGINPQEITSINIREDTQKSPFDSALKRVLELRNSSNNVAKTLFAKIYSDKIIGSMKDRLSTQEMQDTAKYQYNQMKLWNYHWLPTPFVFAYNEENLDTPIYEIISEYWEGPSHDMDHIAIQTNIKKLKSTINSPTTRNEEKLDIEKQISNLDKENKKLIYERLKTINEFAVILTPHEKKKLVDYSVFKPSKKWETNIEKNNDMLKWILFYNALVSGELNIDQIDKLGRLKIEQIVQDDRLHPEIKKRFSECAEVMNDVIPKLTYPMIDEDTWVYRQGDESMHHFKTHKFQDIRNNCEIIKAGVFDACKARMGNINESKAKTLLSPIINLSYDETREAIDYSLENEIKRRESYIHEQDAENIQLYHRKINYGTELKAFDLIGFYELQKMKGRKSKDVLHFHFSEKYKSLFKNSLITYKNVNNLNIPEININYDAYEADSFIKTADNMIEERIDGIRSKKPYDLDDVQKYALESFNQIYQKYLKTPKSRSG